MRNFLVYKAENLRKINAQRRALSQPTILGVPTLNKGQVQYVPEGQMEGEPATCYNCPFYNYDRSCRLMGPNVKISKITYPKVATTDAKPIEYWPCCSAWTRGEPNYGPEQFLQNASSPDSLGLGYINAAKVGQDIGGANCSGKSGGDDCDHYCTEGADKRAEPTGFCRVIQQTVEGGAVCAAWQDDDWLDWQRAKALLDDNS